MKRRAAQQTDTFREQYRYRAGVEGSLSALDRKTGIKHLRVRGLAAVSYCAFLKAAALNILRAAAFRRSKVLSAMEMGPITKVLAERFTRNLSR